MRWLCLLVLSGCVAESETPIGVTVDKNGFAVEKVELFMAKQMDLGLGPMTPELLLTGRTPPMAQLWSPHTSLGYAFDDSNAVTYDFWVESDTMLVAIGWRDGQAALAGHTRVSSDGATITLAPDDVELWSSHACVRYTDGVEYIYLLAHAGCW